MSLLPVISRRTQRFNVLAVTQKLAASGLGKMQCSALLKVMWSHGFLHVTHSFLEPVFIEHLVCARLQASQSALSGKLRKGGSGLQWGVWKKQSPEEQARTKCAELSAWRGPQAGEQLS